MDRTITAKQLWASLPITVRHVCRGERFTVLYKGRPAFRIVPVDEGTAATLPLLADDPIYGARGLRRSGDGRMAQDHDEILYGWKRRGRGARAGGR